MLHLVNHILGRGLYAASGESHIAQGRGLYAASGESHIAQGRGLYAASGESHIAQGRGLYAASGESQFYVTKNEFSFRDFLSRALTNSKDICLHPFKNRPQHPQAISILHALSADMMLPLSE